MATPSTMSRTFGPSFFTEINAVSAPHAPYRMNLWYISFYECPSESLRCFDFDFLAHVFVSFLIICLYLVSVHRSHHDYFQASPPLFFVERGAAVFGSSRPLAVMKNDQAHWRGWSVSESPSACMLLLGGCPDILDRKVSYPSNIFTEFFRDKR